jgi:hypothetical protein
MMSRTALPTSRRSYSADRLYHRVPALSALPPRPVSIGPMAETELLMAIQTALAAASPLHAESHCDAWGRLPHAGVRTSKRRAPCLKWANNCSLLHATVCHEAHTSSWLIQRHSFKVVRHDRLWLRRLLHRPQSRASSFVAVREIASMCTGSADWPGRLRAGLARHNGVIVG